MTKQRAKEVVDQYVGRERESYRTEEDLDAFQDEGIEWIEDDCHENRELADAVEICGGPLKVYYRIL